MSGDRCADCGRPVGVGPDRTIDDGFCWSEATRYDHDKLDCSRVVVARQRAMLAAWERAALGAFGEGTTPANLLEGGQGMEQALHDSENEATRLRVEVEALRGERDEARDELAAVIKGKDVLADALCKVLGMSPSTLTKAVSEAVARLTPALRSAPPGAP
jgi:hypothetical protein